MGLYIDEDGELRNDEDTPIAVEPEPIVIDDGADADKAAGLIPEQELKEITGGKSYSDWMKGAMTPEARAAMEKIIASYGTPLWSQLKGMLTDPAKLAVLGGGLMAASRPSQSTGPTGFQGKIPKYTATRNMLTAPPVGRRPGSGGIDYGGGTSYFDKAGKLVSSNERSMEELRQASINNPFNRGANYEGQTNLGQTDLAKLLADLNKGQTPAAPTTPTTPTTPVVDGGSGNVVVGGGATPAVGGGGATPAPSAASVSVPGQYGAIARPGYQQTPYTGAREGTPLPDGRVLTAQGIYNPKTGDVMTPDGYRVNAFGGAVTANKDTLSAADAELMKGLTFSMDPNKEAKPEEVKNYIQWQMTQANPFGQGTLADVYAKQGITDPYNSSIVQQQAQEQLKRQDRRDAMYAATQMGLDPTLAHSPQGYGTWEDPNWLAKQTASQSADAARGQQQAAQEALSGVTVGGGGIADIAPAPAAAPAPAPTAAPTAATPAPDLPRQEQVPVANRGYDEEVPREEIPGMYGFAEGGLASNGFVVPADVVSHFGNGSSEAGLKLLASKLGAKPIKGDGDGMSDSIPTSIDGKQEARVANDEAFISPEMVKRLGGGDEEKGAKKLYAMMDKIRKARTGSEEQGKQINPDKFMPGGSVKNYATGGTTTLPSNATGSESSLSNWSGEYVTDMLGRGSALAQAPYQAYTGPLTAGASQLQQQAFAGAGGLQTPGSIDQAAGTAGGIANLAANMRYTPQTTDFLGGANVSGLGVAPSYGMGMPQQPTQMGTPSNPIPMPRGNVGQFGGKTPAPLPQGEELYFPTEANEFGGEPITIGGRPQRIKQPPMPMGDQLSYTGGSQDFDENTGTYRSEDGRGMPPSQDGMIQNRMMNRGPAEQPMQGAGLPGLMQTQQPQASQPVGNVAQQYMNPYLESALRPQMAEMQRASDIARMSDAARLTQAGAYGGSRQAIMESEGRRNLLGKQTEALGQGYATAYDKAMQQFNADQARRAQEAQFGATFGLQGAQTGIQGAQAQGQLGALESQSDINNLRAMMEAGGVQRGIESEGIAADKAQFEEARLNPYKMIQFEQSLLSGLPLAAQSYTMPGTSNLTQFGQGATTIAQLLKNLGYKLD